MMTRDSHFTQFAEHTQLKHFLLQAYLKQWATILIGPGRHTVKGRRLWVIDAFAGTGSDRTGRPGSPVIAAQIARAINAKHFGVPLAPTEGMRVIAIEAVKHRYDQLVVSLAEYLTPPPIISVYHGTLQDMWDPVSRIVAGDATFIFLDPFGVDGLDAALLPQFFRGPKSELLVLFSDEGAVRLHGKAGATVPTREQLLAERAANPTLVGFGADFDAQVAAADRAAVERVLAGHASNLQADAILTRAFGDSAWKQIIAATPSAERQRRFVDLYAEVLQRSGASHVLRFEIATDAGRHKYTLLHASRHERAFAAMKDAMDRARRRQAATTSELSLFEQTESESTMLTLESRADLATASDNVARHFDGREVRWSGEYSADTVEAYARDKTPLLFHEFDQLKRDLLQRGYATVIKQRPLTLRFRAHPPAS